MVALFFVVVKEGLLERAEIIRTLILLLSFLCTLQLRNTKTRPILYYCRGQWRLQLCRKQKINYIILGDVVEYNVRR